MTAARAVPLPSDPAPAGTPGVPSSVRPCGAEMLSCLRYGQGWPEGPSTSSQGPTAETAARAASLSNAVCDDALPVPPVGFRPRLSLGPGPSLGVGPDPPCAASLLPDPRLPAIVAATGSAGLCPQAHSSDGAVTCGAVSEPRPRCGQDWPQGPSKSCQGPGAVPAAGGEHVPPMTVDASLSGTLRFRPSSSCGSPSSLGLGPEPCRESSTAGALPCTSDAELANATASLGFPGDPTELREPALEPAIHRGLRAEITARAGQLLRAMCNHPTRSSLGVRASSSFACSGVVCQPASTPPRRWRAGGGDGLDLLDSLRPLILQLVKEAAAQASKDIVPGASASANATPQQSASQKPKKPGKGKGPGGPRPTAQAAPQPQSKGHGKSGKPDSGPRPQPSAEGRGGQGSGDGGGKTKGKGRQANAPVRDSEGWLTVTRRKPEGSDFSLDVSDWDAPLLAFDGLAAAFDALGASDTLRGVLLCTAAQANVASTMAKGSAKACSLSLVVLSKDGPSLIPGKVDGQRRFMKGSVLDASSKGTKAPQVQGTAKAIEVPKKETTVLFVRLPRIFSEALWKSWRQAPSKGMMGWAAKYQLPLVDTFGWKEQRTDQGIEQLFGLIRADKAKLPAILKRSGTEGVFIEPSRQDLSTRVEWLPTAKEESHSDYLERACRERGELGLATCGRSLGLRHNLQNSDRVQRHWVLQGAPLAWGTAEAQLVLQGSFADAVITKFTRNRQGKTFHFKAVAQFEANKDILPISASYDGSEITLWACWQTPRHGQLKQRNLRAEAVPHVEPPDFFPHQAVVAAPAVEKDADGKEVPAAKRPRSQDSVRTIPKDLALETMPRDGNCVFSTLAQGLKWATSGAKSPVRLSARELRARIIEHFKKHTDHYAALHDGLDPVTPDAKCDWPTYLEKMEKDGTYGSALEVKAFSRLFNCRVIIIPEFAAVPCESFHSQAKDRVVVGWLSGDPVSHMDLLIPAKSKDTDATPKTCPYPPGVLDIRAAPSYVYRVYRVGGKASSAAGTVFTEASVWTRSAASGSKEGTVWTAPLGSGARVRSAPSASAGSDAKPGGSRKRKAASAELREDQGTIAGNIDQIAPEQAEVRVRRPTGRPRSCLWDCAGFARCRLCPFQVPAAGNSDTAAQRKLQSHYKARHPGECHSGLNYRQPLPSVVAPLSEDQDVFWRCKFCECGISLEAASSAGEARVVRDRRQHKITAHPSISWKVWRRASYAERAQRSTATRYRKHEAAKATAIDGDFTLFRWPLASSVDKRLATPVARIIFRLAWFCNRCGAPFQVPKEARRHHTLCPSIYGRVRAKERLRRLTKLKERYCKEAPLGPKRTSDLKLFDKAAALFKKAAAMSPCF